MALKYREVVEIMERRGTLHRPKPLFGGGLEIRWMDHRRLLLVELKGAVVVDCRFVRDATVLEIVRKFLGR